VTREDNTNNNDNNDDDDDDDDNNNSIGTYLGGVRGYSPSVRIFCEYFL